MADNIRILTNVKSDYLVRNNRSISFKVLFWKPPPSYMYKWLYYRQTIFNQLNFMVSYVDIIGLS